MYKTNPPQYFQAKIFKKHRITDPGSGSATLPARIHNRIKSKKPRNIYFEIYILKYIFMNYFQLFKENPSKYAPIFKMDIDKLFSII